MFPVRGTEDGIAQARPESLGAGPRSFLVSGVQAVAVPPRQRAEADIGIVQQPLQHGSTDGVHAIGGRGSQSRLGGYRFLCRDGMIEFLHGYLAGSRAWIEGHACLAIGIQTQGTGELPARREVLVPLARPGGLGPGVGPEQGGFIRILIAVDGLRRGRGGQPNGAQGEQERMHAVFAQ